MILINTFTSPAARVVFRKPFGLRRRSEVKLSSALENMGLLSIEDESGPADQRKNELTATMSSKLSSGRRHPGGHAADWTTGVLFSEPEHDVCNSKSGDRVSVRKAMVSGCLTLVRDGRQFHFSNSTTPAASGRKH